MIVVDYTATRKAIARYDRVKPRAEALLRAYDGSNEVLLRRYCVIMDALINHVFDTFYADAWHLTPHEADRFGITSLRELVK